MIRRDGYRYGSARDRARVAAELMEEARFLTETSTGNTRPAKPETTPAAPSGGANGNSTANSNGTANGNGHSNGKRARAGRLSHPNPEDLLASLDAAVAMHPESVSLLLDRAKLLVALGRYAAARADLEQALLLEPTNLTVRTALGIVLLRKGLWADAVPHLREVVEAESWSPTAWFYLGEALNHIDDLDGALAAFVRAAELDPRHARALHGQGIVLDRLRRPDEAALLYRRSREAAAR